MLRVARGEGREGAKRGEFARVEAERQCALSLRVWSRSRASIHGRPINDCVVCGGPCKSSIWQAHYELITKVANSPLRGVLNMTCCDESAATPDTWECAAKPGAPTFDSHEVCLASRTALLVLCVEVFSQVAPGSRVVHLSPAPLSVAPRPLQPPPPRREIRLDAAIDLALARGKCNINSTAVNYNKWVCPGRTTALGKRCKWRDGACAANHHFNCASCAH